MEFKIGAEFITSEGTRLTIIALEPRWIHYTTKVGKYRYHMNGVVEALKSGEITYTEEALRVELIKEIINE